MAPMLPFDLGELIRIVGYPGLFAIIFAESGLIIGFFLPGASLLFTAGFLASQNFLDIRILIPLVAIAAILGDNVGYWFGAKVGIHLFDRPDSRFFKRAYLDRTREFYARHGTRMILFARFVPMVRTFAPILAGVVQMDYRAFMTYNAIGGITWASGITFLGYALGEAFPKTAEYIELVVLTIIVVTCIPLAREALKHYFAPKVRPRAVVFDLDGTLADDHTQVKSDMRERLTKLAETTAIAILSGAELERIVRDVIDLLPTSIDKEHIYLLPQNGAFCHVWKNGAWTLTYDDGLSEPERDTIFSAIQKTVEKTSYGKDIKPMGSQFLTRPGYVAFSAPGLDAPPAVKAAWDPTGTKRLAFMKELQKLLPGYDVYMGGKTSVDVMAKGVNKAHGIRWILTHLNLQPREVLFIGDALYPGGNDAPVLTTGVTTRQVSSPQDTLKIIDNLLKV